MSQKAQSRVGSPLLTSQTSHSSIPSPSLFSQTNPPNNPLSNPGPAPLLISAALSPALGTDADFDEWYRQEHCRDLATVPLYRRTRRYALKYARQNRNPDDKNSLPEPPKYLAIHEFDAQPPERELAATGETPWASKIMGSLAAAEVGVYEVLGMWGDTESRY